MWPMATTTRTKMTVEEFYAATDSDPRRSELIDGEIVVTEVAFPHGRLQAALIGELEVWAAALRAACRSRGRPRYG
jgi:Uma2 family endonuclease